MRTTVRAAYHRLSTVNGLRTDAPAYFAALQFQWMITPIATHQLMQLCTPHTEYHKGACCLIPKLGTAPQADGATSSVRGSFFIHSFPGRPNANHCSILYRSSPTHLLADGQRLLVMRDAFVEASLALRMDAQHTVH